MGTDILQKQMMMHKYGVAVALISMFKPVIILRRFRKPRPTLTTTAVEGFRGVVSSRNDRVATIEVYSGDITYIQRDERDPTYSTTPNVTIIPKYYSNVLVVSTKKYQQILTVSYEMPVIDGPEASSFFIVSSTLSGCSVLETETNNIQTDITWV